MIARTGSAASSVHFAPAFVFMGMCHQVPVVSHSLQAHPA